MYSYIKGELVEILPDSIVVENHGIGYNIQIPGNVLDSLDRTGQTVKIYTYTYVREDAMMLYGFLTREDLEVFGMLIGVSGIGPKGALAILSVLTPDDLRFAILGEDDKTISKAPGIGKKMAQKLIIELRDKMSLEDAFAIKSAHMAAGQAYGETAGTGGPRDEAIQALVALGYSQAEAMKALKGLELSPETTTEEILKAALKQMALF